MDRKRRRVDHGKCREIARGVYGMEVGRGISRSNVYLVESGSSWTLIDAASANCGRQIQKAAESLFGADTPPAAILLTHVHPDHTGSVLELVDVWDCTVYVHPEDVPMLALGDLATLEKYANPLDRWVIFPLLRVMPPRKVQAMLSDESLKNVVEVFDPSDALPGLPAWECIPTPGHTPGHVSFFRPRDRVLITGDALLTVDLNSLWGILSWIFGKGSRCVAGPPWYSTWDWKMAKESVKVLAELEPRVLGPGHGVTMSEAWMAEALRAFAKRFAGSATEEHTIWQDLSVGLRT